MPTVDVRFAPLTAHVRTARLVALAVARRAGVAEDCVDEIRLAVGEVCSRAVGVHLSRNSTEPVQMRLSDDVEMFTVEVTNVGTLADDPTASMDLVEASTRALADESSDAMPPGFGLAVVSGLVDDLVVESDGGTTRIRMRWPASEVLAPGVEATA